MRFAVKFHFLFIVCCFGFSASAQDRLDPYDGPVQFISSIPGESKGVFACSGQCAASPVISAVANDRIFIRLSSMSSFVNLMVTDDNCSKVYLKKADSSGRTRRMIRQLIDIKGNMKVRLNSTLNGAIEYMDDELVNDGLYTMVLRSAYPAYVQDWSMAKRISYFLNHYFADAVFLVDTKLDSTENNDTWTLKQSLQKGYFSYATIRNSRKWGFGADKEWSCETMYWLSDKEALNSIAAKKEMGLWKTGLSGITGLKKIQTGYQGDGLEVLLYEMTPDPVLAKFPREAIWTGYDQENNVAGMPAKLYLSVSPVKRSKDNFMIEVRIARDRDDF